MGMLAVVDRIVADVPVPTGTTRDGAASMPSPFLADTLYGWPLVEARRPTGDLDRSDFGVRLALIASAPEGPGLLRSREVSELLDDGSDAIAAWVLANRIGPTVGDVSLWGQLRVARIDHDALRLTDARGVLIDLAGWRFIEED